ncbi:MAG: electron transfer flavoprotein subunit beta, partial [Clostridia bacterium]|nr:electron transfer flavoprotein subunit beta [Clostridia bacterium]
EYLGIPNLSNVLQVDEVRDGRVFVTASLDNKVVRQSVALPCLLSVEGEINSPRLPSYKVKQTVTDDRVQFLSFADMEDADESHYGLKGSATQVERIFPPEKNTDKRTLGGDAREMAEGIYALMRDRKLL